MTPPSPEAPRTTVTAFEAAVARIETAPTLSESDRTEVQQRARELQEHVRSDVRNRSFLLRGLLRVDTALHVLRSGLPGDPRVQALTAVRTELEARAGGDVRSRAVTSLGGFGESARDFWTNGVRPFFSSTRGDSSRAATSAAILAGGLTLGAVAYTGTISAVTEGDVRRPTLGQRIGGFFRRMLVPLLAVGGLLGLGSYARARAAALETPELREERNYMLGGEQLAAPPIRGMVFRRAAPGAEVAVEKDGVSYRMIFENAGGLPPPSAGEESLGAMMQRLYSSGSTGSGVGVEQGGLGGGSFAGVRTGESFVLTESGIDAIRTALESADAATPAGALADVPLRFTLSALTPSQLTFIRRCIARGATIVATDEGALTVTTKVRLRRGTAAPTGPAVTPRGPLTGSLGTLPAGTHIFSHAAATPLVHGVGPGAVTLAAGPGSEMTLAPDVKIRRRSATLVEVVIGASPTAGTYTLTAGANTVTFVVAPAVAPSATPADTVSMLDDNARRPRIIAGELAAFADAGLAAHAGSAATYPALRDRLTELNGLVPAAHRGDAVVRDAVGRLLTFGGTPLRDKRFVTASGTYRIVASGGQLSFELVPVAPAIETLTMATARDNLVIGRQYRIAIPASARRAIVSTRNLTGAALAIDNTVDSFVTRPIEWSTYTASDGPVELSTADDAGTTYLLMRTRRACTFRVRFDEATPAAGTISAEYTVTP